MKKLYLTLLLLIVLFITLFPSRIFAQNIDPQYIFVRKNPMQCNPADCTQIWNMDNPNIDYYQGIIDVYNKVGTHGSANRKLGIGVLVYYNEYDFDHIRTSLQNLLVYAQVHTVPLLISFDSTQWWDKRPDLWNWWDPGQPGYNPDNKNNVEWTCDNPTCALKKSWRNWGQLIQIKPQPNLASPRFMEAGKDRLKILIPLVTDWYNNLPDDKKWLLGGVTLGTEVNIDNGDGTPVGYAAVRSLGLTGGISQTNMEIVIGKYITEMDRYAIDLGIPRNKVFNHASTHHMDTAITETGYPGWSLYFDAASHPATVSGLDDALNRTGSLWSVPEWFPTGDINVWTAALRNTLNYRNNKFVNIANWESIRDIPYVLDAVRTVVNEQPACWVGAPLPATKVNGNSVSVSWQNGENNNSTYLNISDTNTFNDQGTFQKVNIAKANVTGQNIYTKTGLSPGNYYYLLATDGCNPTQRRIAYGSFQIPLSDPANLNGDFRIDYLDVNLFLSDFSSQNLRSDLNKNSKVDIFDFNKLLGMIGR